MEVRVLNIVCHNAVIKAFENFKHNIDNAIFPVDRGLINLHLKDIETEAGTDILKWYMKNHKYTDQQYNYLTGVKIHYIKKISPIAVTYGLKSLS